MRAAAVRVWTAAAVLWMFAVFTTQVFSQPAADQPFFQADSDSLVSQKVLAGLTVGEEFQQYGGFLHYVSRYYDRIEDGSLDTLPYLSQSGVQGMITHLLYQIARPFMSGDTFLTIARAVNALVWIGVILLVIFQVLGSRGLPAVATAAVVIVFFRIMSEYSLSLYWVIWAHFLPFAAAFVLYPRVLRGKLSFAAFCLVIGALVTLKSLSGYEYITNVIAAPSVPIVFYGLRAKMPLRAVIMRIIGIGIAGSIGFAAAVGIHIVQGTLYFGSIDQILSKIADRAAERTIGTRPEACFQGNILQIGAQSLLLPSVPYLISSPLAIVLIVAGMFIGHAVIPLERAPKLLRMLFSYYAVVFTLIGIGAALVLRYAMFLIELSFFTLPVILLFAGSAGLIVLAFVLPHRTRVTDYAARRSELRMLGLATLFSIPVSWTWLVFASGHVACHPTISAITFYMPFGLMLAALIAAVLSTRPPQDVTPSA